MALTRKFYDALARDLLMARPPVEAPQLVAIWLHCVTVTANNLAVNNGAFKRDRFYEACGLTAEMVAAVAA